MAKYIIQVWDTEMLNGIEDGADADSFVPIMTIVEHSEEAAERAESVLDNLIQVSSDSEVREAWIISKSELQDTTPGDLKSIAALFRAAEAEATL